MPIDCYSQKAYLKELSTHVDNTISFVRDEISEKFPITNETMDMFEEVLDEIRKTHSAGNIPYGALAAKIEKRYKDKYPNDTKKAAKEALKALHIFQLQAILESNDSIRNAFLSRATARSIVQSAKRIRKRYKGQKYSLKDFYRGAHFPLDLYGLDEIKALLGLARDWVRPDLQEEVKMDDGTTALRYKKLDHHETLWGKLLIAGMPLGVIAERDPTGAVAAIDAPAKSFYLYRERDSKAWMGPDNVQLELDEDGNPINRNYGFEQIYASLSYVLQSSNLQKDNAEVVSKIDGLFAKMNTGEIIIKDGKMMIYSDWGTLKDKSGAPRRYTDTKDFIKGFFENSLMPIEDYIKGDSLWGSKKRPLTKKAKMLGEMDEYKYFKKEIGDFQGDRINSNVRNVIKVEDLYLDLNKKSLNQLQEAVDKSQDLFKRFFKWSVAKLEVLYDQMLVEILASLTDVKFKNIKYKSKTHHKMLRSSLLEKDDEKREKIIDKIEDPLMAKRVRKIRDIFLYGVEDSQIPLQLYGAFSTKSLEHLKMMKHYFPHIHPTQEFLMIMIPEAIVKVRRKMKTLGKSHKKYKSMEASINLLQDMVDQKTDESFRDLEEFAAGAGRFSTVMGAGLYGAHYMHLTGAFDPRDARVDNRVPKEYIDKIVGQIQRLQLNLHFIDGATKAWDWDSDITEDMVFSTYMQIFGRPDTPAGIPGGIDLSYRSFWGGELSSQFWGHVLQPVSGTVIKGAKVLGRGERTGFRLSQMIKKLPPIFHLHGLRSASVNIFAESVQIIHGGGGQWQSGMDWWSGLPGEETDITKNEKKIINDLIDATGETDFSDYYANSLCSWFEGNYGMPIEVSLKILKDAIKFHKTILKHEEAIGKREAWIKYYPEFVERWGEANANILRAYSKKTTEALKREAKLQYWETTAGIWLNMAIARADMPFRVGPPDSHASVLKRLSVNLSNISRKLINGITKLSPFNISMSSTEQDLRTNRARYAIWHAMETGYISTKTPSEMDETDKRRAREIVSTAITNYVYRMSPSDAGWLFRGTTGQLITQFVFWGNQHMFLTEIKIWKDLARSYGNYSNPDISPENKAYFKALSDAFYLIAKLLKKFLVNGKVEQEKFWNEIGRESELMQKMIRIIMIGWQASFWMTVIPEVQIFMFLFRKNFSNKMGPLYGTSSQMANLALGLWVLAYGLIMDWDDEEEWKENVANFFLYRMRNIPLVGYGVSSLVALVFMAIGQFPNQDVFYEKGRKALVFMPTITALLEEITKEEDRKKRPSKRRVRKKD